MKSKAKGECTPYPQRCLKRFSQIKGRFKASIPVIIFMFAHAKINDLKSTTTGNIYLWEKYYNIMNEQDRKWKVLESEYLFKRPWLTVKREKVELPNGNVNPEYYILEYPDWVNVLAITKDNQFVMIRQYRHGIQETRFELCAGVCEKEDASPMVSAQRELYEETGYGNGNWKEFMVIAANPSAQNNFTHCFLVTDVEKISTQHLEDTEDLTVHLLSLEEVKSLLANDEIKQALHAAPLWKYMALRSNEF